MWRALVFIGLLAVAAFGAVWLADRPGSVVVAWGGYEYRTTVAVAVIAAVGIALFLSILWTAVRYVLRLPGRLSFASRARRRAKGYAAVSRGMVAVGAGDPAAARRHAGDAERLLGREPLTLLLKAQAAQIAGDRPGAEAAFKRMIEDPETRVLGLRGLFVEARRRGDDAAARAYAAEAARLAPAVGWANEALLEAQSADGDWRGALATIERRASLGLLDKTTARRQRAVLLTADALARCDRDEDGALENALEAVKLAPDLVPAAALAGRILSRRGDLRRAARTVEAAWKLQPHPDLADTYLNLRPGDSALDRLARAETLARLSSWDPEARMALARAALEAHEFARASETLRPLLEERPTVRACLLMADIEQAEHGATGQVREWLARAARSPRDPVWIADGVVSDHWAPISPVTGRLDAFVWQAPPDVLTGPGPILDDVVADLDDKPTAPAAIAAPEKPAATAEPAPTPEPPLVPSTAEAAPVEDAAVPREEPAHRETVLVEVEPGPAADEAAASSSEQARPNGKAGGPEPVIFPVRPPDDPGPKEPKPSRARLFG
jgi:HemY protein